MIERLLIRTLFNASNMNNCYPARIRCENGRLIQAGGCQIPRSGDTLSHQIVQGVIARCLYQPESGFKGALDISIYRLFPSWKHTWNTSEKIAPLFFW